MFINREHDNIGIILEAHDDRSGLLQTREIPSTIYSDSGRVQILKNNLKNSDESRCFSDLTGILEIKFFW